MKYYYLCGLLGAALFVSCSTHSESEDRIQELETLESDMIDVFQETLERSFGNKNAIGKFLEAMDFYQFNYLLDVDRNRLSEINKKLYGDGWFYSYFMDKRELGLWMWIVPPSGVAKEEYCKSDAYKEEVKKRGIHWGIVLKDSIQYQQVRYSYNFIDPAFPLLIYPENGSSYYRNELYRAKHPVVKKLWELIDTTSTPSGWCIWGIISHHRNQVCADFATNRELQLFLTIYFWKHLCYSANIDYFTGKDKRELLKDKPEKQRTGIL